MIAEQRFGGTIKKCVVTVSAAADGNYRDAIMRAYRVAVAERYRFLSFGDAMLIA